MPSMPCDVPRNWKNDPISGTTHALGSSRKLRTFPDVWSSADASLALGPRIPWLKPNTNWRGKCWKVAFCVFQWDPPHDFSISAEVRGLFCTDGKGTGSTKNSNPSRLRQEIPSVAAFLEMPMSRPKFSEGST